MEENNITEDPEQRKYNNKTCKNKGDIGEIKKSLDKLVNEKEKKITDLELIITNLTKKNNELMESNINLTKQITNLNENNKDPENKITESLDKTSNKTITELQEEIEKLKIEQIGLVNFHTLKNNISEFIMKKIVDIVIL
ncbi:8828_t:CDS:2 [Cetraspora pellucida]|uniref:8828_t:CDS:1 n=1 Tax=Cetraspora pellucida TaxID=1433469 RepID=A0A9N8VGF0_9GLOM|nr:8828_t:CDS:2 [Cetraspora pellucida]